MKGFVELTDERAVLAEFADEAVLTPLGRARMIEPPPLLAKASTVSYGAHIRRLPLLDPRAPLVPLLWTVLIGCVAAMALGAFFAIGLRYMSIDGLNPPPQAATIETLPLEPSWHGSLFVPYRAAVEGEKPMAAPSGSDPIGTKRARGSLRWIRRTIAAVGLSPLPPIIRSSSRGLRLLS